MSYVVRNLTSVISELLFSATYLSEQLTLDTYAFTVSLKTLEPEQNALTRVNLELLNKYAFNISLPPDAFAPSTLVHGDNYQVEVGVKLENGFFNWQ